MKSVSEVLSSVAWNGIWSGPFEIQLWGRTYEVDLRFYGDEINGGQQSALSDFLLRQRELEERVENELFAFYSGERDEFEARYGDAVGQHAPVIDNSEGMSRIAFPQAVLFQYENVSPGGVFGFLFRCSWEEELGAAVAFSRTRFEGAGTQDILL
ncbi:MULTISPECIES: hypothetical protein [Luteibacter]|uniref:DUF6985 domain-containing protein n=1 Tax=Luteibacter sp. dw_328 TaxID=2719796 RepID=UPI0007BFD8BB|nr:MULTISPECIES: hypothetical protein [Luteibacter]